MLRFFPRPKTKVIIFADIHTSDESLELIPKLVELANLEKIIFINESLDFSTADSITAFHRPLDNIEIKLFALTVNSLLTQNQEYWHDIDMFFNRAFDEGTNLLSRNLTLVLYNFIGNFSDIYKFINESLTNNITIEVSDALLKKCQLLCEQLTDLVNFKPIDGPLKASNLKYLLFEILEVRRVLLPIYAAFLKCYTAYLKIKYPNYIECFEHVSDVLNLKINKDYFVLGLRNLFMAANLHTAMQINSKNPVIAVVGRAHTIDAKDSNSPSLQNILKSEYQYTDQEIEVRDIKDANLILDQFHNLIQLNP